MSNTEAKTMQTVLKEFAEYYAKNYFNFWPHLDDGHEVEALRFLYEMAEERALAQLLELFEQAKEQTLQSEKTYSSQYCEGVEDTIANLKALLGQTEERV